MKRLALAIVCVLFAAPVLAQQEIDATKIYMGSATIDDSGTSIVLSALDVTGAAHVAGVTTLDALLNANGGIATDTDNFTVSGTTGAATSEASFASPRVYGYGASKELHLGGTAGGACTSYPDCEALEYVFDGVLFTQRLVMDTAYQTRWYIDAEAGHLNAYNGSGWLPLIIQGGPTRISGGGLHIGSTTGLADPGLGNVDLDGYIGLPGYVSQATGWRVDNSGGADFRYLFTDELIAKSFIIDLEQALAGGQIISKSVAQVGAAYTVPAAGAAATITLKDLPSAPDMAVFESGDWLVLRSFSRAAGALTVTNACGVVTAYADGAGTQTWTFTRAAAPNAGAMAGGAVIPVDALALDWGTTGDGLYEVSAIDGTYGANAPYARIYTWASATGPCTSGAITLRAQMGNVAGVTAVAGEHGFLGGDYAGKQYARFTNEAAELYGIDFSMWNGGVEVLRIDRTAPSFAMGVSLPSAFGTGTGIWFGRDVADDIYKWRVGIPGGDRMSWDGTTALIKGRIEGDEGLIGGWAIGTTSLADAAGVVGMSSAVTAGDDIRFWAGHATPASAPYRVTEAGTLYASGATVSGNITVGSGSVVGAFTVGTSGSISSGATAYMTGTGYWLEYNGGTPRFHFGNPSGAFMKWDGSALTIRDDSEVSTNAEIFFGKSGSAVIFKALVDDTTASRMPLVSTYGGYVFRKTDGLNGTTTCSGAQRISAITIEYGIVTSVTCS